MTGNPILQRWADNAMKQWIEAQYPTLAEASKNAVLKMVTETCRMACDVSIEGDRNNSDIEWETLKAGPRFTLEKKLSPELTDEAIVTAKKACSRELQYFEKVSWMPNAVLENSETGAIPYRIFIFVFGFLLAFFIRKCCCRKKQEVAPEEEEEALISHEEV